jgi:D-serine deaminase-like pyridoxal phosphate-dependent protein
MNRRNFLQTGVALTAGVAASSESVGAPATSPAEFKGRNKADLPTPALLVDLDAFDANLKKMADHCRRAGCGFRPHAKTHKCPEIAKRQVASGALGVCVATVPEAESMAAAGITGVLLTSPIVERGKVARMVDLARKGEVLLSVGHLREVELLSEAAEAAGVRVDVLVDVDVGDRRTGILPGQPALELGQLIAKHKGLRLRGLQAYAGHASHAVGFARRQELSRTAMNKALETKELFARAGLDARILSGGSTGTYAIDSAIAGVTELQVGSYIFMDVEYRSIGGPKDAAVYTDFLPSLTVLTTVVSVTHEDRVSVDAGTKAFATDVPFKPEARDWQGLTYNRAGDEFGRLTAADGARLPHLGDRLEFLVPHCDPTANLYDRIYAVRGDRVEDVWPITARREGP